MADENEEDYTEPTAGVAPVASGPLYGQFGNVLPGPTTVETGPKTSRSFVKPTAGYMQSIDRQEAAAVAEKKAVDDQTTAAENIAKAQKVVYDNALIAEKARIEARAAKANEWQTRIDGERARFEDRVSKASAEPTSWWADRTEGERTRARIGSWLSAFGAAITGGDNLAIKAINDSIERDLKVKQAKSERLFKLAEQSRGMLADAYRAKAEELGDMDAQRVAAWQNVSKELEAIKLGFLPQEQRAAADEKKALIDQKAAQVYQDAQKNLETKVVKEDAYTTETRPAEGKAKTAPVYNPKTGEPMFSLPAADAKALNDQGAKAQSALDALEEYLNLEEGSTWGIPNNLVPFGEVAHAREQAAKNVAIAMKRLEGQNLGRGVNEKLIEELTGASGETHLRNKADEIKKMMETIRSNLSNSYKVKGAGEIAPNKAESAGHGAKPAPKQSRPAAQGMKDDHDFVADRLNRDANALDSQRTAAFEQAQGWLGSGDPKLQAKAARVFKILRDELPKD